MDRRQFLINLSVLIGTSVTSLNTTAIEAGLDFKRNKALAKFTDLQLNTVKAIANIIIPQTDTPSASAAQAHLYVDYYVHQFMQAAPRKGFIHQLNLISGSHLQFLKLSEAKQLERIEQLDEHMYDSTELSSFYKQLKHLIVIGYFTSEVGATQALNFDPIPGPYQEMKLKDIGRVWY